MKAERLFAAASRLRRAGVDPRIAEAEALGEPERRIVCSALPYTMTSVARLVALVDAVRYCVRRGLAGDFAECGVWRGGSVLAMILTLQELGQSHRDIHLFDTFEGMTAPGERDVSVSEEAAADVWRRAAARGERPWPDLFDPQLVGLEAVRENLLATRYPPERLHFVCGPVEESLPRHAPERLALLRLDTDWYESTRHELRHLYPRLAQAGVLIVDDYGHWEGCRHAVDEYFAVAAEPPLLNRIDYTGRMGVKV